MAIAGIAAVLVGLPSAAGATVLDRPDRLGDLLVRNGAISREDLTAAI